jgi:pseudouridine-5'-phosphate glycosidase
MPTTGDGLVRVAPEVADALAAGQPVVALESTIITHGMPHPVNLSTALELEAEVRALGAVPATIAVLGGHCRVGLEPDQLRRLAVEPAVKASRRDLPVVLAQGVNAGTTVAATMYLAHLAGISVFATGGVGGAHQGAAGSFDISADLQELGRTPVTVVCAGAKSILDLPLTMEILETMGVLVLGYRCDHLPTFYTRGGSVAVPHRVDDVETLAAVLTAKRELNLPGGVLVANPIPEVDALAEDQVAAWIEVAHRRAAAAGVNGAALTPFLLSALDEISAGECLRANVALVRNNARLAGRLAVRMAGGSIS